MPVNSYKDLLVYQKSKTLTIDIIKYFSKEKVAYDKKFLINQIFRAISSIPANIAEGYGRNSKKNFRQFVNITRGSSFEVDCWLDILKDTEIISNDKFLEFNKRNTEISKMLSGLMKKLS